MKLAIFGASGHTGIPLVEQALAAGHTVRALVRNLAKLTIKHDHLTVIQGDVSDPAKVNETIDGCEAVLTVIGHSKTSPKDIQAVATRNIIDAMNHHGIRRLVSLTGAGVRDPKDQPKTVDKVFGFLLKTFSADVAADAEQHAALIRASGLNWVIVRGPMLTEGPRTGKYYVGYVGKESGTRVSRADIADFMLKQVKDNSYLQSAPMISSS